MRWTLWVSGLGVFLASAISMFALIYLNWEPVGPQNLVPGAGPMALALFLIAAVAGWARQGIAGWTMSVAAAGAALAFYGVARNATTNMQGATVVMPRMQFLYAAAGFVAAALIVVSLGYWTGSTVATLASGRRASASSTGGGRRLAFGTLIGIPIVSLALGAWLSTTHLVLDVTDTDAAVHRLSVSESALQLDATTIPTGEVIFLVTVYGHPAPGLSLVDVSRSGESNVGTPPTGSVDYLVARMNLLPGPWAFRLDGMTAEFDVTP